MTINYAFLAPCVYIPRMCVQTTYLFKVPINCIVKDTLTVCFVHHDKSIYLFWKKERLNIVS